MCGFVRRLAPHVSVIHWEVEENKSREPIPEATMLLMKREVWSSTTEKVCPWKSETKRGTANPHRGRRGRMQLNMTEARMSKRMDKSLGRTNDETEKAGSRQGEEMNTVVVCNVPHGVPAGTGTVPSWYYKSALHCPSEAVCPGPAVVPAGEAPHSSKQPNHSDGYVASTALE